METLEQHKQNKKSTVVSDTVGTNCIVHLILESIIEKDNEIKRTDVKEDRLSSCSSTGHRNDVIDDRNDTRSNVGVSEIAGGYSRKEAKLIKELEKLHKTTTQEGYILKASEKVQKAHNLKVCI